MKIDEQVLMALNQNIAVDLIAINQYFLHARILKHRGFEGLGKNLYKQSIAIMKEVDSLTERVLLQEGSPMLDKLGELKIGDEVSQILACDIDLEKRRHIALTRAIGLCEQKSDFVSRSMLQDYLTSCEEYIDYLETQEQMKNDLGVENYLQSISSC